ncbi:dienelactone hydrolase family protein [Grimontia sp. NTOU-MAR1]|uniref:dienelactone hydrolase family protein n=1 Tax=Grimontia sp. NTOU-MAR1 TaxID=3111011 RepID=UPI003FA36B00
MVNYSSNGMTLEGYYAPAQQEAKGSVILIHDWDELTGYEQKRVDMLSSMGYNTFAIDLYGQGNRPVDTKAKKEEVGKLYRDRAKMRGLLQARLMPLRCSSHRVIVKSQISVLGRPLPAFLKKTCRARSNV